MALRREKQLALDDLLDQAEPTLPSICRCRASVHRLLVRHKKSRLKTKAETKPAGNFKEYAPGFVHMDSTYLPRVADAKRRYCFVVVDRATRLMHCAVYNDKSVASSTAFLRQRLSRFPFTINKLLTDSGFEFCPPPIKKKGNLRLHPFEAIRREFAIEHRRTLQKPMDWPSG